MNRIEKLQEPNLSLCGQLVVSAGHASNPLFWHAVVLVVEHQKGGSVGVVLNKPFISDVGPLWNELTKGLKHHAEPPRTLHFGGPLSGPVVAVHNRQEYADAGNSHGVYLAAQSENLQKLTTVPPEHYRLLVGHVGWGAGVLEKEILEGDWKVIPASADIVFSADDEMFAKATRRVGTELIQLITGVKSLPESTLLN